MRILGGLLLLTAPVLSHAQTSLQGIVRDRQGIPAPGAAVTITCEAQPAPAAKAIAGVTGLYRVDGLRPCQYHVAAVLKGQASAPAAVWVESGAAQTITLDLSLGASAPDSPLKPKFAASGIRGLIDPGGYSAPANAAAVSGLLTNMAVAKRGAGASAGCQPAALVSLRAAHETSPADLSIALSLADGLIANQQFQAAETLLSGLAENDVRALTLKARANEGMGRFEEAARVYHQLNLAAPSPENLFSEGYELLLAGNLAAAQDVYASGLVAFPHSVLVLTGAGTTQFLQQHPAEAIGLFLQAADADPKDPRPYPLLAATSAVSSVARDRVLAATERHLAQQPADAAGHLAYAVELLHLPDDPAISARAEAQLRDALGLDPSLVDAHYQLALLLNRRSAYEEAVRELQLTTHLDPARREAHYRLALALARAGQQDASAAEMKRFQQARAEEAASGPDLRRYLSVLKPPGEISAACVTP